MDYSLTLLFFAAGIALLVKNRSTPALILLFTATLVYGLFVFPRIDGIAEAIKWRIFSPDGTVTYDFIAKKIEKDWSSPTYWDHLLKQFHQTYGWVAWPTYFGIMWLVANTLRTSATAQRKKPAPR
jgi:hypothetical protein